MLHFDPGVSMLFSGFICWNWIQSGLEQILCIAGMRLEDKQVEPYYIKLLSLFLSMTRVTEIQDIFAYSQGSRVVLEIMLIVPDEMHVHEIHDIMQVIQSEMERYDGVERCFVHIESRECTNMFDGNCEPW